MGKWISNRNLSTKLYFILILAVLAIGISNTTLIYNLKMTSNQMEKELYDELYYSTFYLLNADRDFYQADQAFMSFQAQEKAEEGKRAALKKDHEENLQQVKERMMKARNILLFDNGLNSSEMESYFSTFFESLSKWESATSQLFSTSNSQASATEIESLREEFDNTRNTIDLIQQGLEESAVSTVQSIHNDNQDSIIVSSIMVGLCIVIIFVLGFLLIRTITKPVTKLVHVFQQVSDGNLQMGEVDVRRNDEIGQLASASKMMIDNLRQMVRKIQDISQTVSSQSEELTQTATEVSSGSQQIASTMQQLSAGAEEQASSSNEISTLMENLSKQIRKSNHEGKALQDKSENVYEMSNEGKKQMDQSVKQMNEITTLVTDSVGKVKDLNKKSQEISKLVVVIQGIAEQTNLLALNAAIEAARAGESGKGFAVVADEVRKLAEQVGNSVSEITEIINSVQKETESVTHSLETGYEKVEEGNQQIQLSRTYFDSINESMSEMRVRIENIASNLVDIAQNSDQVNQAGENIAVASEQASAGIEQSASTVQQQSFSMQEIAESAESLAQLSEELIDMVGQFKI